MDALQWQVLLVAVGPCSLQAAAASAAGQAAREYVTI